MADPEFTRHDTLAGERQALREFFAGFPFFQLLGFELVDIEPGHARLAMSWRNDLCQPAGIIHGGAIASLVDTAFAHSILLTPNYLEAKDAGGRIVSLDLRIKYLRPVSSGRIVCDARITRQGRQIIHTTAEVADEAGKAVASGDSIYMMVPAEQLRKK